MRAWWFGGAATGRLLAASAATVLATACVAPRPETRETEWQPLPADRPTEVELPVGQATVWADVAGADAVRCWSSGPGDEPRTLMRPHYSDIRGAQPVTRDGRDYHTVGGVGGDAGTVRIDCEAPAGTELYVAVMQPE